MKVDYREEIQRKKAAIELYKETIEVVKKNEHNELTLLDVKYGRGYPTIERLEKIIELFEEKIIEYREMLYYEQFQSLIDERIIRNRLESLLDEQI